MNMYVTNRPVLVIDSNFLGYQALYTMKDLSHEEVPTAVVYGFLSRLLSLCKHFSTNQVIFLWDSRHSFRRNQYADYKSGRVRRPMTPEERKIKAAMFDQFILLRRHILREIGFNNVFLRPGYESDDTIAMVVRKSTRHQFIVVTGDNDLLQLLRSNVRLYNPTTKKMMTHTRFFQEYGITPDRWPMVKAVGGCSSDSVKGVPGVAESSALKYVRQILPAGKKLDAIKSAEGQSIIKRNLPLVTLPFQPPPEVDLVNDDLNWAGLKKVSLIFGLDSFLSGDKKREWKTVLNPDAFRDRVRDRMSEEQ